MHKIQQVVRSLPDFSCRICGKKTRETGWDEWEQKVCLPCMEIGWLEVAHIDREHDDVWPVEGCPLCDKEHKAKVEFEESLKNG